MNKETLTQQDDHTGTGKPGDGVTLSDEQNGAIEQIECSDKRATVLTGQAGAGKSTIINFLQKSGWWVPCATTGKAAMHIGGVTVDSLFCFRREDWSIWSESYLNYVMAEIPDNILIDESPMIGRKMGDLIINVAETFRKRLLLVGDWAQAGPVKDDLIIGSDLLEDYDFIKLTENHRQGDGEYLEALNKLRVGEVDDQTSKLFQDRVCPKPPDDDQYLRMFATNRRTDAYNQFRLWSHVSQAKACYFRIYSSFEDMRPTEKQEERPRSEAFRRRAIDSAPFGHGEPLAPGCRVVITSNKTPEGVYVNGDTGVLVDAWAADGRTISEAIQDYRSSGRRFRVGWMSILLDRTGKEVRVGYAYREIKDPTGRFVQTRVGGFPVKLGYALTIHKAQGMTVEKAWFDMASLSKFPDDRSRHGLAYVALSRTRSLDGLLLGSWVPDMVYCNPEISELL